MVFGNYAGLLPSPQVAVKPPPVSNQDFAITSALGEIGNLVKKKADVESLRTEANKYADYAEARGNTSIATLLRGRADQYSLLTDTNAERSSFLKGVVELSKIEEDKRANTLKSQVAAYDNMLDNKITASQQELAKTVQLYNNWERNYATEKNNYNKAAAKSGDYVAPFTERVNPFTTKMKTDEEAYQNLIRRTPDRVNKIPGGTPMGGSSEPALPVQGVTVGSAPGADDGYESPAVELSGNEVSGKGFNDIGSDGEGDGTLKEGDTVPEAEDVAKVKGLLNGANGTINEPTADLFPGGGVGSALTGNNAPPSEDNIPTINSPTLGAAFGEDTPLAAPSGQYSTLAQQAAVRAGTAVNTSPVVVAPTVGAAPTNATPNQTLTYTPPVPVSKTGVQFIPEPPEPKPPEGVYNTEGNWGKYRAKLAARHNILTYNRDLRLLDKSLYRNISKFQKPELVDDAAQEIRSAGELIGSIQYPVSSKEWIAEAKKIMKDTEDYIKDLNTYTTKQQDENSAAAGQQAIEVIVRTDAEPGYPGKPATKVMTGYRRLGADGKYRVSLPDKDTGVLKDITDETDNRGSKYITGKLLGAAPMIPGQKTVNVAPGAPPPQDTGVIKVGPGTTGAPPVSSQFNVGGLVNKGKDARAANK